MRELASCVSEYAVQVSESSCSSSSSNKYKYKYKYNYNPCIISPAFTSTSTPSIQIQNCVTCLYRSILPNSNRIITTLTWTASTSESRALTLLFHDHRDASTSAAFKITSSRNCKSKGTKSLHLRSSKIQLHWDLSTARYPYRPGPEPIDAFYVLVLVDSHPALILGDKDYRETIKINAADAQFAVVSRQEHFSGNNQYSTKAQFCEGGGAHDILIRCSDESEGNRVLSVCIDKKVVIRVKKLQWNFRGNQTIFLDGLVVDLMWDVHDWFYSPDSGYAVFMFRTRTRTTVTGFDHSRLWMDEKKQQHLLHNNDQLHHFSFIIYASNNV